LQRPFAARQEDIRKLHTLPLGRFQCIEADQVSRRARNQ
jgi:hypothetical protein